MVRKFTFTLTSDLRADVSLRQVRMSMAMLLLAEGVYYKVYDILDGHG